MANLTNLTDNYLATPQEGFTTSTSSSISSGASTVPLNSVSGYTDGEPVTLVIEPDGDSAKQVFTGVIDASGSQVTDVVWTEGTNQSHAAGSTVADYVTATHIAAAIKHLKTNHEQNGGHKTLTDSNGNEWVERGETASAVNHVKLTNAATGNAAKVEAAGDDTNIDLELTAKGSGSVLLPDNTVQTADIENGSVTPAKIAAVNRQNHTTNTTITSPKIQTGWSYKQGDNSSQKLTVSVTFPEAFSSVPVVIPTYLGLRQTTPPTDISDFNQVQGVNISAAECYDITTTGMTISVSTENGGNLGNSGYFGFSWIAIGPA